MKRRRLLHTLKRQAFIIAAALFLVSINFGLKYASYRRVTSLLLKFSPIPDPTTQNFRRAFTCAVLVNTAAARLRLHGSCLRRTLTAWWILRWMRIPSDIRIGLNLTEGHAWLEHHGVIVNDSADVSRKFRILYSDELSPERLAKIL